MTTWQDIQKGKKPWRPTLSVRSVATRLAVSLPFLAFGIWLVYRSADCHVVLQRNLDSDHIEGAVYRSNLGIQFRRQKLRPVTGVRMDSELRQVEKLGVGGSATTKTMLTEASVSRIALIGGSPDAGELSVSEFRFGSDHVNHPITEDLKRFLADPAQGEIHRTVPYESRAAWVTLAMLFLFGLGGFVFVSIPIDAAFWWVQWRYRVRNRRT